MKKTIFLLVSLIGMSIFAGCGAFANTSFGGFYQSEMISGRYVQISIDTEKETFTQYIDNREVNSGTYESLGESKYKLVGDIKTFEIDLAKNDSFELTIKNLIMKIQLQ